MNKWFPRWLFLLAAAYPYMLETIYFLWACTSELDSLGESSQGYFFLWLFLFGYLLGASALIVLVSIAFTKKWYLISRIETSICFALLCVWYVIAITKGAELQNIPFQVCR